MFHKPLVDFAVGPGRKYLISDDQKELTIMDVAKGQGGDTGSYQCSSENSVGILFKDAFLSVIGKY